jgi:hypothetical protein
MDTHQSKLELEFIKGAKSAVGGQTRSSNPNPLFERDVRSAWYAGFAYIAPKIFCINKHYEEEVRNSAKTRFG